MSHIIAGRPYGSGFDRQHPIWHWIIRCLALLIGLIVVLIAGGAVLSAADLDQITKARALVEAGEFAPALELARAAGSATQQHDAILAEIAQAQAAAGDRKAAFQSIARMNDDRAMTGALDAIRSQPPVVGRLRGGNQADFDSLIDLITATVAAPTWDTVGGQGSIMPFPNGVYVDAQGVLRPLLKEARNNSLAELRKLASDRSATSNVRRSSPLRKISLVQLERQAQLLAAQGRLPTEDMQALGGLQRIKYVLVYPDEGDLVLAGPAGDWQLDAERRLVGKDSNHPVVRLDDLVAVLRHMMSRRDARFGCSITPTQAALAEVQAFISESNKSPLKPGQRDGWLKQLREKLGQQEIEVYGIDPRTRAGLVLVEADYRMKLVGMGLEEGVLGVPSYLSMVEVPPGQAPPPMDVLRWWFTLNYDSIVASTDHDAFELRGQGVQVLSENELLTAEGKQVHTGNSDALNAKFARNFTKHFAELAVKYPVYAELQNLCDLALVGALLRSENLPDNVRWHMLHFGDPQKYIVPLAEAPKSVDTVMNYRMVNRTNIIVGVSGGVTIEPGPLVKPTAMKTDDYGRLKAERMGATPKKDNDLQPWWWD